jgi:hypothetical protein
MSYPKGNFYTENSQQIIDDVVFLNSTINSASMISSAVVPTSSVKAIKGALCVCTLAGSIGLYLNKGTYDSPTWTQLNGIDIGNSFLAFSLPNQVGTATINQTAHTILVTVAGSLTGIAATFTVSTDATVKIGEVSQVSGITTNNFNSSSTYTITSEKGVAQDWVITAALETYDLSRDETNGTVVVSIDGSPVEDGSDVLTYGDVATITATADEQHTSSTLTVNGEAFVSGETLTVSENVAIVYVATANEYIVTNTLTNITSDGELTATYGVDYEATLTATSGTLPTAITITINDVEVTVDTEYTYNSTTGDIVISGQYVVGNVVVTASAVI